MINNKLLNISLKTNLLIVVIIIMISIISCYDSLYNNNKDNIYKDKLTVTEVKDVFRQKIRDYETVKMNRHTKVAKSFFPEDYTPQWNKAVMSENEYIWSMDIPILTSNRLMVISRGKTDTIYTPVPQKLVIIKNKESGEKYMFILTLIPDIDCSAKFKNGVEKTYTHVGDVSNFTGIAVYSTWNGKVIQIKRQSKKDITQLNFKDRKISKNEKTDKLGIITSGMGELVLMGDGDDWFLGEIESSEVTWCRWCWHRIDECTCGDPQYCSVCGYSVCICDEYSDDNNYSNDDVCPNCGRPNCDGTCESGGNNNGSYNPPPPQENQYSNWTFDTKTTQIILPILNTIKTDCFGNNIVAALTNSNIEFQEDNTQYFLIAYRPVTNRITVASDVDYITSFQLVEELVHALQQYNGNSDMSHHLNMELEAKLAAYEYCIRTNDIGSLPEYKANWDQYAGGYLNGTMPYDSLANYIRTKHNYPDAAEDPEFRNTNNINPLRCQ
ncbi:MAG: hypothetical protein LBF04_04690 [Prevotellaceae bacterium]|jgi:hypothetical protein|nr:hypothetical protein [Prevotellaceae bacterium]